MAGDGACPDVGRLTRGANAVRGLRRAGRAACGLTPCGVVRRAESCAVQGWSAAQGVVRRAWSCAVRVVRVVRALDCIGAFSTFKHAQPDIHWTE